MHRPAGCCHCPPETGMALRMRCFLKLFVYGTLKKGFSNHAEYCSGVHAIERSAVRGRLYWLTRDVPVMAVPEEDVLAAGSGNPLADVAVQAGFSAKLLSGEVGAGCAAHPESGAGAGAQKWRKVGGELLTFDDPGTRLPLIDSFEEFTPGGPSIYTRVLVPVVVEGGPCVAAWTYISGSLTKGLEPYEGDWWEPRRTDGGG
jgi:gamma-glutamylcyclotransferase (GGCT)/AIG2-like uncharacterized protein YtfP